MRTLVLFSLCCVLLLGGLMFGWVQALRSPASVSSSQPAVIHARSSAGSAEVAEVSSSQDAYAASSVAVPSADGSETQPGRTAESPDLVETASAPAVVQRAAPSHETRWPDTQSGARRRLSNAVAALRQDAHHPAALRDAIAASLELQELDEALGYLLRAVANEPDDPGLYDTAVTVALQLGRWLDALELLRERIRLWPNDARPRFNLAVAHQALGHLNDAQQAWSDYLALRPEDVEARFHRGVVRMDLRDWPAAADDFERLLRDSPAYAEALLNLLLALHRMAAYEELGAAADDFLSRNGDRVAILNRAAELLWSAAHADGAAREVLVDRVLGYCERSLVVDADQPDIIRLRDAAAAAR